MQSIKLPTYLQNILIDNVSGMDNLDENTKKEMIENAIRVEDIRSMQSYQVFNYVPPDQMHLINSNSNQKPTPYLYLELSSQPVQLTVSLSSSQLRNQQDLNKEEQKQMQLQMAVIENEPGEVRGA